MHDDDNDTAVPSQPWYADGNYPVRLSAWLGTRERDFHSYAVSGEPLTFKNARRTRRSARIRLSRDRTPNACFLDARVLIVSPINSALAPRALRRMTPFRGVGSKEDKMRVADSLGASAAPSGRDTDSDSDAEPDADPDPRDRIVVRQPQSLALSMKPYADYTIISVQGVLRAGTTAYLSRTLEALASTGSTRVVLDLSRLYDLDAGAVAELSRRQKALAESSGGLWLAAPRPWVRRLLDRTCLRGTFSVYPTVLEALTAITPADPQPSL